MSHPSPSSSRATGSTQASNSSASLSDSVLALSQHNAEAHTTPWYQRETWLAVCLVSFLPVVLAIFSPPSWKIPLIISSGVLMLISMLMLVVHRRRQEAASAGRPTRMQLE